MKKTLAAAWLLLPGLTACVTQGEDFKQDFSWIKKNKTTQVDVSGSMGAPYKVGRSGSNRTWTYGYYDYSLFGDSYTRELKIYWNTDKTVRDYSYSSSFPEDRKAAIYQDK